MNNNQELAIKFGVPMFETCEKLDWKKETLFTWYSVEGKHYLILTEEFKNSKLYEDISYPAPQMHEIAPYLPQHIEKLVKCSLNLHYYATGIYLQYDFGGNIEVLFSIKVIENNYAEAYAKLYLLLKENQLLK